MAAPLLLFISARLQAVVAAMLCLMALQFALTVGGSAGALHPQAASSVRMALRR